MQNVIILTGPSGAGKTTTSYAFLNQAEGTWAYINQDEVRQQIKAGYESAGDYEYNWNADTRNQWVVSVPICTDMIKRYLHHGINVIVDMFSDPADFERWQSELKNIDFKLVVLLPSEDETVTRNTSRDDSSRLKENKIRLNHRKLSAWKDSDIPTLIIDSTNTSVEHSVDKIVTLLA